MLSWEDLCNIHLECSGKLSDFVRPRNNTEGDQSPESPSNQKREAAIRDVLERIEQADQTYLKDALLAQKAEEQEIDVDRDMLELAEARGHIASLLDDEPNALEAKEGFWKLIHKAHVDAAKELRQRAFIVGYNAGKRAQKRTMPGILTAATTPAVGSSGRVLQLKCAEHTERKIPLDCAARFEGLEDLEYGKMPSSAKLDGGSK